jgi:hypothetical protein
MLGSRALLTLIRMAGRPEREPWDPILVSDPRRAVALFKNAGWVEPGDEVERQA